MASFTSVEFDPFAAPALLKTAPSTESQRELWTASHLGADASAAFNEAVAVTLEGGLDRAALGRAFEALIAAHEALHTTFSADGTSMLVEEPSFELPFEDWSTLDPNTLAERLAAARHAQVTDPFDLSRAPLCRARLLKTAPDQHVLLLSAHHIACDGWSMAVLLKDLGQFYTAARRSTALAVPERPRFSDYAEAERQRRSTEEYRKAERFWLDQFVGELPVVDLPSDRPRPPLKTYASDRVDHVLGAELVKELKALGARNRASFFATLLAGFKAFVHRLTGVEELVVGIPAAGQSFTDQPELVGHCVNMLPLKSSLHPGLSFAELLGSVRRGVLDAYEHQQLTFGALLKQLAVPRDPSRLPLITLTFNLDQAITGGALQFDGLRAEVETIPRTFETFDLFVNAAEKQGVVTLETQYNTDLYDRATIERWLRGFEALLRSAVQSADQEIGALDVLTDEERAQLQVWNSAADRPYPPNETIEALLRPQLHADHRRVALEAADGTFSYADLNRRSLSLAAELRARNIGRGSLVGISLERSSRLLVAVLGVLRSGAAYVPLDPSFPKDRLSFMAEDSGLALLVSERRLEAELPSAAAERLFLDDLDLDAERSATDAPELDARAEDPAYVIYTSGSTGKPKGVVVPHGAAVNFLRSMAEAPGLGADDRLLAVTTLSFDISVLELLLPLSVGATIVLATSAQAMDGVALRDLLQKQRANVLQATPATWRLLLAAGERFGAHFKGLCGGEALPKALADELLGCGLSLWNMYGPTETTVWSTCHHVRPEERRIRVGRPIANTQIHIVDAKLREVPIGVAGELCIAGRGVTLGYLNRPELTEDRFVPNPFGAGRLYKTGDLARFLPDGTIECLGRSDGQVKVRGYRIELGEIESVLAKHPDVKQPVVLVREDRPGDQRLVAYVVPTGSMPGTEALREHLKGFLPDYMVPQHFVEMSAMPLTPNGKVDKKRLPAPVASATDDASAYVEPATDSERLLQQIWQRVLGLPRISVTDDFFQLGGHSLLAAQVMTQITRDTGTQLSMRRLFEAPTIRALAKALDDARAGDTKTESIPRREPNAPAPLSPMQQRIWFIEEMNPGTSVYNLPSCFRLFGRLDTTALKRALDTIAARHTTLRTTLGWHNGQLCQAVKDSLTFDLTPIDLTALSPSEKEQRLLELLREAAAEPFDLTNGPLARAALFRLSDVENVLFFMPHHSIWDGWSFDVFLDELDRLYAAFSQGKPNPLEPLAVTYGDFAAWHPTWLSGAELERQTKYWLEHLSGELPILELPTDAPRPALMSFAGKTEQFELDSELTTALSKVASAHGATLYMLMLAAFDVLLFRLTGQTDLIVGTPIRGRNRPELEPLLGYFVNMLALRTQLDPDETFGQVLQRVRRTCVEAFEHQDMPIEILVQKLDLERDASRTPVYSAFFTFQDVRNRKSSVGDLSYEQIHVHAPVSPTDVSLWVKQLDNKLVGGLDFATDLFQSETVRRWLAEYQELLRSIAANSERSIARLPLLPAAEVRALAALSQTARPYPVELWLHQLIETQVDRTPERVAASFEGARLTYAELDQRANQLARALQQAGVGEGHRVGICLQRSLDMLVAVLAAQKAGAAYVPLDPAFPKDRLRFMVEDSGLSLVIVHRPSRDQAPALDRGTFFDLDEQRSTLGAMDSGRLPPPSTPSAEAAAYIIYTSGSTGKPKGVVVPHRAAVNLVTTIAREPGFTEKDRVLAVTTLSFDIAVVDLYVPLIVGAEVVIASRETASDGDLLDEAIDEYGITVLQATPATWRLLLAAGFHPQPGFKVLCGGEPFPRDLAEKLLELTPEVWNLYGPTETTVYSTAKRLELPLGEITIGRPVANTSVHVVDANGELAPWGSPGELWIGGDGVALGYHDRPELTADRFVQTSFAPGRVYKTGDLVRVRGNGEIQYLRRNDNQVKLRGFRIELGEIEATLARQPAVEQAVVLVREDRPGDQRLVAYLVTREEVDEATLRSSLRQTLPEYMVPQHFVRLEQFPLTPNGKVDRRALPSPAGADLRRDDDYVAPSTDKERLLAQLWQEVLGVQRVGAQDNFFDMGGHSLLCLQMTARLETLTGARLNPRIILLNNLAQVATMLPDARPTAAPPAPAPLPAAKSLAQRLLGRLTGR